LARDGCWPYADGGVLQLVVGLIGVSGSSNLVLASSEGDDAADWIVGRNAHRDSIAWYHLDTEAAHSAAQLRKHLVALVALHAI